MKTTDYMKNLRAKDAAGLNEELAALRKEQFNLRMQHVTGQLNKASQVGDVKKKIARLKTLLRQQVKPAPQQVKAS